MDFVIENEQEQKQIKEKIYKKPDEKMKFNQKKNNNEKAYEVEKTLLSHFQKQIGL